MTENGYLKYTLCKSHGKTLDQVLYMLGCRRCGDDNIVITTVDSGIKCVCQKCGAKYILVTSNPDRYLEYAESIKKWMLKK